jgi:hypothetical protein
MAEIDIRSLLKTSCYGYVDEIQNKFDDYFDVWNPSSGIHKRFKWRPNVYLKDSPFDILTKFPDVKVIANRVNMAGYFPDIKLNNQIYFYENNEERETFDFDKYFDPIEKDGKLLLRTNYFDNSAAIALYSLLYYMGFRKIYFLGMDMNMLGVMEYAAPYTFRSMLHFYWFIYKARGAFSSGFKLNFPIYYRPKNNFSEQKTIFATNKMEFARIYDKCKYVAPTDYIRNISYNEFIQNGG